MRKEKLEIKVLIEGDQVFTEEYSENQKIQVIVNKTLANLQISDEGRELRREGGTPILDYDKTINEIGIVDGECLRYMKKAPKPNRDKGFA